MCADEVFWTADRNSGTADRNFCQPFRNVCVCGGCLSGAVRMWQMLFRFVRPLFYAFRSKKHTQR